MIGASTDFTNFDMYGYFYALVRQVPERRVTTYGALARALGDIVASRACGYMLSINPDPIGTPCYKVVRSDGSVGKFTHPDGSAEKIRRLNSDGIGVLKDEIQEFESRMFDSFDSELPLEYMKEEQESMASMVSETDNFTTDCVAAVDVSYDDFVGYGAMVIEDHGELTVKTKVLPVNFPYIPGYLSYREFKFIRELANDLKGLLLVDANGFLHPRHIGLATFAGLKLDIPTIGVAKSLLTGKRDGDWITMEGKRCAYSLTKRTIVSAGNQISLESSIKFLRDKYGNKYPELLKIAHQESVKLRLEHKMTLSQQTEMK